ncbi:MAG: hypothetical protein WCJ25_02270 [Candidatus Moraniibacteriota bacterium]
MFSLLRTVIWVVGAFTVGMFVLRYFGYEPNWNYWNAQKEHCAAMATDCRDTLVRKETDGAVTQCQWNCVDLGLMIKKL